MDAHGIVTDSPFLTSMFNRRGLEVIEAIDNQDDILMEEELGDLLLQVVMHSCLAEERGVFDLEKVAQGISDKLLGGILMYLIKTPKN